MNRPRLLFALTLLALLLTCVVIAKGAYVRLSHAGLGCPDWPFCYGHLDWPRQTTEIAAANASFPERPVEIGKAWREMWHRYLAGLLILLVVGIAWVSHGVRRVRPDLWPLALACVLLIGFQAALGAWTVTLKVKPLVVTAHLFGGLLTLILLTLIAMRWLQPQKAPWSDIAGPHRVLLIVSAGLLALQVFLGGWTSTNYAALACPDFPTCQGQWWPPMDFSEAFVLWRGLGIDYEGGVLDHPARVAIHVLHRVGAIALSLALLAVVVLAWRQYRLRLSAAALLAMLATQVGLGINNVLGGLAIANATAHTLGAGLLAVALVVVADRMRARARGP